MKSDTSIANKAYIKTVKELQLLFSANYRDGGWLPGGREMAKKMGVSHSTYCKALACLEHETFVRSYPCKGHFVIPFDQRCHKIGIILRDGSDSPFVEECDSFVSCIKYLHSRGFDVQFIQGTRPDQLVDNSIAHGVDGVIWFKPSESTMGYTRAFAEDSALPLVVVCWGGTENNDYGVSCVSKNYAAMAATQAAEIKRRGLRKMIVVGDSCTRWSDEIMKFLNVEAVDSVLFDYANSTAEDFEVICRQSNLSGIISCGSPTALSMVFSVISGIDCKQRPALFLSDAEPSRLLPCIVRDVQFYFFAESPLLGEAAARLISDHLQHNRPLTGVKTTFASQGWMLYSRNELSEGKAL